MKDPNGDRIKDHPGTLGVSVWAQVRIEVVNGHRVDVFSPGTIRVSGRREPHWSGTLRSTESECEVTPIVEDLGQITPPSRVNFCVCTWKISKIGHKVVDHCRVRLR